MRRVRNALLVIGLLLIVAGGIGFKAAYDKTHGRQTSTKSGNGITAVSRTTGSSEYAPLLTTMKIVIGAGVLMLVGAAVADNMKGESE